MWAERPECERMMMISGERGHGDCRTGGEEKERERVMGMEGKGNWGGTWKPKIKKQGKNGSKKEKG